MHPEKHGGDLHSSKLATSHLEIKTFIDTVLTEEFSRVFLASLSGSTGNWPSMVMLSDSAHPMPSFLLFLGPCFHQPKPGTSLSHPHLPRCIPSVYIPETLSVEKRGGRSSSARHRVPVFCFQQS
jgi:hypothetical protein